VIDPAESPGGFLTRVSADKLPPEILDREVERLISGSGLKIEMNRDTLGGGPYELVVVDYTSHPAGSLYEKALRGMAREVDDVVEISWESSSGSLKLSQVSHAVALGLEAALQAGRRLTEVDPEQGEGGRPPRILDPADVKLDRLPDEKTMALQAAASAAGDSLRVEAGRCFSCGTCNLCQNCVLSCPDACCLLDEEKQRIVIDLYHCKGCGICAYECPRGVMGLENLG
jgi:Pyruvate/2-oxoacid:ferredoxin oxidoreductase delta subunit